MKRLPIGVENYEICNGYYYVDKTLLIKDIIKRFYGKVISITMPRRFGKSLTLSMIDYYFSINKNSNSLFTDKKIYQEDQYYLKEMNKYPVIHINMQNIKSDNFESLKNKFIDIICLEYRKYNYLFDSDKLLDIEKQEFQDIISKKALNLSDYILSIYKLSILLYKHYSEKVIILVDEYDTVIEDAYRKGYYDEAIGLFKEFYTSFLKGNDYLKFAVLTGVLQIAKESIFSDLNNLEVYSVEKEDLNHYFGFTKDEVATIFKHFNINTSIDEVSKWYGGYGTNQLEIYNPWSILNYTNNEVFDTYWTNTGSNDTILNLIKGVENAYNELNELINSKEKTVKFNNAISYKDVNFSIETIISYLVQAGYLVVKSKNNIGEYLVQIPNLEIQQTFERELIERNFNSSMLTIALSLRTAIETREVEKIKDILNQYVLTSFSYFDLKNEKNYQAMLSGILSVLFTDYVVKTEVNNKNGRCDLMIIPKNNKDKGFIIEIKYAKGVLSQTKLTNSSSIAIKQIRKNEYYNELIKLDIKNIYLYGIAFDDKHAVVSVEVIK